MGRWIRAGTLLALAGLAPACGPEGAGPLADAGPDVAAWVGESAVLDGSGSSAGVSYAWSLVARPVGSAATLSYPQSATPAFVPDVAGLYTVQLVVSAGGSTSLPDVAVVDAQSVPAGPRARAGPDVRVGVGGRVWASALGSLPPPGPGVTYAWSLLSKPPGSAAVLLGADPVAFDADLAGDYLLRLTVTEGALSSQDDLLLSAVPLLGPPQTLVRPGWTESVAVADVTGDGRADLVCNTGLNSTPPDVAKIHVFAGNAVGGLEAAVTYPYLNPAPAAPGLLPADVDGDGRTDVVVGGVGGLSVLRQNAGGTLDGAVWVASAFTSEARWLAAADFSGDGRLDVAALTNDGDPQLELYVQSAGGALAATSSQIYGSGAQKGLKAGDVNGDGRPDVVAMSGSLFAFDNLAVFHGLAGGGLGGPVYHDLGLNENTYGVGVGDLNGDGRDDVAVSWGGNMPASLSLFLQGSGGVLGAPVERSAYQVPEQIELGDLDGDGRQDMVSVNGGHNGVSVHLQGADGTFGAWTVFQLIGIGVNGQDRLEVADVNGDGKPDVVCDTSVTQPDVHLLLNLRP